MKKKVKEWWDNHLEEAKVTIAQREFNKELKDVTDKEVEDLYKYWDVENDSWDNSIGGFHS